MKTRLLPLAFCLLAGLWGCKDDGHPVWPWEPPQAQEEPEDSSTATMETIHPCRLAEGETPFPMDSLHGREWYISDKNVALGKWLDSLMLAYQHSDFFPGYFHHDGSVSLFVSEASFKAFLDTLIPQGAFADLGPMPAFDFTTHVVVAGSITVDAPFNCVTAVLAPSGKYRLGLEVHELCPSMGKDPLSLPRQCFVYFLLPRNEPLGYDVQVEYINCGGKNVHFKEFHL